MLVNPRQSVATYTVYHLEVVKMDEYSKTEDVIYSMQNQQLSTLMQNAALFLPIISILYFYPTRKFHPPTVMFYLSKLR